MISELSCVKQAINFGELYKNDQFLFFVMNDGLILQFFSSTFKYEPAKIENIVKARTSKSLMKNDS